jgi:hypothetical protein
MRKLFAYYTPLLGSVLIIIGTGVFATLLVVGRRVLEFGLHDITHQVTHDELFLSLILWGVLACWGLCGRIDQVLTRDVSDRLSRIGGNVERMPQDLGDKILNKLDELDRQRHMQRGLIDTTLKQNRQLLAVLGDQILRNRGVPLYFQQDWIYAVNKLADISQGSVEVFGTKEQMWKRYVDYFGLLKTNAGFLVTKADFLATCIIPRDPADVETVFGDLDFERYCRCSYDCVATGVVSELKKLFILDSTTMPALHVNQLENLMNHFRTIERLVQSNAGKMSVRVAFWSEIESVGGDKFSESDFMIWGKELLVQSKMNHSAILHGANLCVIEDRISRARSRFDEYFGCGQPIGDWLKNVVVNSAKRY